MCVLLLVSFGACNSGGDGGAPVPKGPQLGSGQFSDRCKQTEDCASGLCVRVDANGGICSKLCQGDAECPHADNWACVVSSDPRIRVCACRKLADKEICADGIDNDCDGKIDDCRMCNGIAVPDDDPQHCGTCDHACHADQSCIKGACVCPANAPRDCAGHCTDTATDSANCGACGVSCVTGLICREGSCVCPNASASTYCPSVGCIDTSANGNHCGSCDNVCTFARSCSSGSCSCSTAAPNFCAGVGCVDFKKDGLNCGACGNLCMSGHVCTDGACVCPAGQIECSGTCVDTKVSTANCGGCGKACGTAQACSGGMCGCSSFGFTVCGDTCANLQGDPHNCGACGHACDPGERCLNSTCTCDSSVKCDGTCESTSDSSNCGACGNVCPTGQYCGASKCTCQGFGLTACGSACVDLKLDKSHCGSCTTTCRQGETCNSGFCACPSGQTYCDTANSCVNLSTDTANCGTCGNACRAGEACVNGKCSCATTGQQYCASAGTCVDTVSNAANCGACDKACRPTEICQYSSCRCNGGTEQWCASQNACVDTYSNNQNCGTCDHACPSGTHCTYATCYCDQSTDTLCTDACYNLQTNKAHCGSCTNACAGNYACIGGQCKCPDPVTGAAVRITNNTVDDLSPVAAWDGTHLGVAYARAISSTYSNLRFALLNADATVASDVALTNYGANVGMVDQADIEWNGSEYAIVWVERDTSSRVMFLRLDAAGVAKGAAISVGTATALHSPAIAWSSSYGGYGVAYDSDESVSVGMVFRRIGATGSNPEAANTFDLNSTWLTGLDSAPDGSWALGTTTFAGVNFVLYNADGSRTAPVLNLTPYASTNSTGTPGLLYDGAAWTTTFTEQYSYKIFINRGTVLNSPQPAVLPPANTAIQDVILAKSNGALAIGWKQHPVTSSTVSSLFRMQRFAIPATLSSTLTPIHGPIDILATQNIPGSRNIALVSAGANAMIGVWADDRWGSAREIYAAPVNLMSCP